MALRVLLADESSTIKKVFQLALQDFAVEVRPVNIGLDVLSVAQNFKPDIVFADVLLTKRSGYEVSADIKRDPSLSEVPVVLMWSGFMELDEDKFQASMANAQLEKPFDVSALRKLVSDLVPATQGSRISQFLTFPKMPSMEESPAPPSAKGSAKGSAKISASDEEFQLVSIPKMKSGGGDKFKINLSAEELDPEHVPVNYRVPTDSDIKVDDEAPELLAPEDNDEDQFAMHEPRKNHKTASTGFQEFAGEDDGEELDLSQTDPHLHATPPRTPAKSAMSLLEKNDSDLGNSLAANSKANGAGAMTVPSLDAKELERLIRRQSQEVIESVVWKVVPEIATEIIEREIKRLLKERESNPY